MSAVVINYPHKRPTHGKRDSAKSQVKVNPTNTHREARQQKFDAADHTGSTTKKQRTMNIWMDIYLLTLSNISLLLQSSKLLTHRWCTDIRWQVRLMKKAVERCIDPFYTSHPAFISQSPAQSKSKGVR